MRTKIYRVTKYIFENAKEAKECLTKEFYWYIRDNYMGDIYKTREGWIIDEFTNNLEKMGFNGVDVGYSGFNNQGDGASFTGEFNLYDATEDINKIDEEYREAYKKIIRSGVVEANINRMSNIYAHEETMYSDILEPFTDNFTFDNSQMIKMRKEFEDGIKEMAKILYKKLEDEYEKVMSEEFIRDYIVNNEIEVSRKYIKERCQKG